VQPDYDFDDLLPAIRLALTSNGEQYALPFYGESSFTFYNKAMFDEAGLTMPEQPTWDQIREFACELHDPDNGQYGIVLRGLPGWGEVMAPMTTVVNTYGGRWFDEEWMPQLDSPEWNEAVHYPTIGCNPIEVKNDRKVDIIRVNHPLGALGSG
jgi:sorbitol/mannitol transport system substrate-binding protein